MNWIARIKSWGQRNGPEDSLLMRLRALLTLVDEPAPDSRGFEITLGPQLTGGASERYWVEVDPPGKVVQITRL